MKSFYALIEKLMNNPTRTNLMVLDKILKLAIPFNAPHGFKLKRLTPEEVVISLPNRKLNHNHIGGVHACAIATVGEYCAGMALLTSFGISKYRLILSELKVKYSYQGRKNLLGHCNPSQIEISKAQQELESHGKYLQQLNTTVSDKDGKEIAVVTTIWQLKSWDQVKTK